MLEKKCVRKEQEDYMCSYYYRIDQEHTKYTGGYYSSLYHSIVEFSNLIRQKV